MTKETLIKFLVQKPGYIQSGAPKIAELFGVSLRLAKLARKEALKITTTPKEVVAYKEAVASIVVPSSYKKFLRYNLNVSKVKNNTEPPSLKQQVGMHILLGCNHVPFEHKALHKKILELISDHSSIIKGFHLLGDFMDLNTLSSHDKGKFTAVRGLTLNAEYEAGNHLLDAFDEVLPDCWKTYMYGNHEDRHNRWMSGMDNAKTPLQSPKDALHLLERGYQVKTSWSQDYFTVGRDFDIFHGIYFSIHNGKAHLDKLRRSCAYVHTHRSQVYREGQMAAYNLGSCADFTTTAFNYATRPMKAQWANGFGINMVDEEGRSNVTQIHVNPDGSFYFGGKQY